MHAGDIRRASPAVLWWAGDDLLRVMDFLIVDNAKQFQKSGLLPGILEGESLRYSMISST